MDENKVVEISTYKLYSTNQFNRFIEGLKFNLREKNMNISINVVFPYESIVIPFGSILVEKRIKFRDIILATDGDLKRVDKEAGYLMFLGGQLEIKITEYSKTK